MRRKERVALVLFSATMVILTAVWAIVNPLPRYAGDSYARLAGLLRFVDGLPADLFHRPMGLLAETSHGGRPPLYQILAAPFVLLFGRSESAALAINSVLYLVLILSVYKIGRLVKSEKVGLLSAFLASTYPPVVHLSHTFLPVFALVAFGALSVWLLLVLVDSRTVKSAWLFGASVALGLLVHPNFISMIGMPALFSVAATFRGEDGRDLWRWRGQSRFFLLGLVPSAAVFLTIVLSWYLTIGQRIFTLYQSVSEASEIRGSGIVARGFPQVEASSIWYARTAPMALSNVLLLFLVVGVVAAIFSRKLDRWILVVTAISSFVFLSLQSVLHWMYMAQVLPLVAVLSTVWIVQVRPTWLARSLSLVCLAVGSVNLMVGTLGARPWIRPAAVYLGVCPDEGYSDFCPRPVSESERSLGKGDSPEREILAAVLGDPDCHGSRPCRLGYIKIGRPPRFQYYGVKYWPGSKVVLVSPGTNTWGQRFHFSALLKSDYLVHSTRPVSERKRHVNYRTAAARFLQSPPREFTQAHKVVGEFKEPYRNIKVRLLKRVKPLTAAEAHASISAIDLPEKYKTRKYKLLLSLYRKEGRLDRAVELCEDEVQPHLSKAAFAGCLSARVDLARALKSEGKTMEAIAHLRTAMQLAPESFRPVRMLADIYRERGGSDEALKLYQEALRISPKDLVARVHLAVVYRNLGESERAVEELNETSSLFPESSWPLRELANTYWEMGDKKLALAHIAEAVQVEPGDIHARFLLGSIYERYGRQEEAILAYRDVLAIDPDHSAAKAALSRLLKRLPR